MNKCLNGSSIDLNNPSKWLPLIQLGLFTICLLVCSEQQLYANYGGKTIHSKATSLVKNKLNSRNGILKMFVNAEKVVSGKIVDDKDIPLEGVTITEKGTSNTVQTNSKGEFKIKLKGTKPFLVISSVGFNTKEIPVGNTTEINVQLKPAVTNLDDVVIIGYGAVKKKDLTGAVGKVNVEDLQKAPVKSFDEALAGRIAGVNVASTDGQPGGSINIVIRGNSSLTQSNAPLYVVDGFPIESSLNNLINPADIESIEVLKDASATAIYGARGANGVIIISTKKGKEGPPTIRYETYYGLQNITKRMEVLSPYEFVKYQNELNASQTANTYLTNGKAIEDYKDDKGIDWQDKMFRQAAMQNHSLTLSGGTPQSKYLISGNYLNQDGVIINSGFKRYQLKFSLDQTINKTTKVGLNVNGATSKAYGVVTNTNTTQGSFSPSLNLLYSILGGRPTTNGLDIQDSLIDPLNTNIFDYRVNPYIETTNQIRDNIANNILVNALLDKTFIPGLVLRVTGGINYGVQQANVFNNSRTQSGNSKLSIGTNGVNGSITFGRNYLWSNENTLTYTKTFPSKNKLTALIGMSQQGTRSSFDGHRAINIPNESLGLSGLDEGTPIQINATSSEWVLRSYLMRVNYDFKGRFLLTFSNRYDGSSKFAEGNRWKWFPSGAFAWRFSKEKFMRNLPIVNDAKLRIGYGKVGNNRVTDYSYTSPLTFSQTQIGGFAFNNTPTSGSFLASIANKNLKWETIESFNLGLDVSLLKDRISFTVDGYTKKTNDLLYNSTLSYTRGFDNLLRNIGSVRNSGIEITINTANIKNRNFTWTSSFNISYNRSKVLSLAQGQPSILTPVSWDNTYNTQLYMARLNQPIAQFYGFLWDGIYQYQDFDYNPANKTYLLKDGLPTNGNSRSAIQPGDPKYKDINGDGLADAKDYTVIGRPEPIHIGGLSNNFSYKNFDLNVFFQWSYGNEVYNANRVVFERSANYGTNVFATYANRWTPDNPSNQYVKINRALQQYDSRVVEDASYIRLKTVSLGYNIPNSLLKKAHIKGVRLYVSGQNLYTWTKYTGYDPEVSTKNNALTPGFDYSAYPRVRTITFGANVTF